MNLKSVLYAASIIVASICVSSCSDDKGENLPQPAPTVDYDQLKESAVQEFIDFAKNPRPSFYHDKVLEYLQNVAKQNGWKWERDDYGNCWIDVPATKGYEDYPNFILQAHTDMVCDAAEGETHDYQKEVGTPVREGNLLRGEHINLGADNGIGVGMILAIAKSNIGHGPLRCLFTADEDAGMYGVKAMDASVINADYLFTMDSEDLGEIVKGCSGGCRFRFTREFERLQFTEGLENLSLSISGLRGGHSGVNIGDHRLNAIVVINEVLRQVCEQYDVMLVSIDAGTVNNAIATSGTVTFAIKPSEVSAVNEIIESVLHTFTQEYPEESINHKIVQSNTSEEDYVCIPSTALHLGELFKEVKYGVFERSDDNPTHVTKSANIGPMNLVEGNFYLENFARADFNEWLENCKTFFPEYAQSVGFGCELFNDYPAWYNTEVSPMVSMFKNYYAAALGRPIAETFVQGGIEPTYFSQMHPGLQVTCFGPQIDNAHSIKETLHIDGIKPILEAVVKTLQNVSRISNHQ